MSYLPENAKLIGRIQELTPGHFRTIRLGCITVGLAALVLGLLLPCVAVGRAEEKDLPTGEEIMRHVNERDEGEAVSQTLAMELVDSGGERRIRTTRVFRKYYGKEKRTLIFYQSPTNIKNTAFLTFDYPTPGRDDDQWLYLPSLRKVRRISAANRGEYFLGTDFTYDDIKNGTRINMEDYSMKTIGKELIDGRPSYVVELIPVNDKITKELGYSRVHSWVDAEIWIVRKFEFWNIRGEPMKTIRFRDIRQVQGFWTVHQIEALNYTTKHQTLFTFSEINYDSNMDDALFTTQTLSRGL